MLYRQMSPSNKMSEDVILFLEENGFVTKPFSTTYFKHIDVDSVEVLVTVFFNAERESYYSAYCIQCCDWPNSDMEKKLDSFQIPPESFDLSFLKRLISNIDIICKRSSTSNTSCGYRMIAGESTFHCYGCGTFLPKELYK